MSDRRNAIKNIIAGSAALAAGSAVLPAYAAINPPTCQHHSKETSTIPFAAGALAVFRWMNSAPPPVKWD
jgi:hypothetical protein